MTRYLKEDIISGRNYPYGYKGDTVEVITYNDDVCIVQDQDGNRFSCRTELLTDKPLKSDNEHETKTAEPVSPSGSKKVPGKKAAPPAQPGLFG